MSGATDGLPQGRRAASAAAIAAAISVTVLDAAMVNIALPFAAADLHLTPAEAVWLVNAYQITVVGLLIPASALGEILGFRRVWAWGLALFTLGAVACAFAPGFAPLLAARVAQGAGSAAVMALTAALVRHTYPQSQLGRAIGVNAMTVAACSAVGPSLGAAVLSVAPWPAVFVAHVPIGLLALLAGTRLLPRPEPESRPFDGVAAALNAGAFGAMFLGLDLLLHVPVAGVAALAVAVLCFRALLRRELGKPVPMLPLDLLRIREVRLAVLASSCIFAAHMVTVVALPFHLSAAGLPAWQIGLALTPYPIVLGVMAPFAGRWADQGHSSALSCLLGGVVLAVALLALALLRPTAPLAVGAILAVAGLGFGFFQAPNNRTMLAAAPRARAGGAGGMQATARVLGQSFGAVLAAMAFTLAGPPMAFVAGAVLAAGAGLFSALRR
ncbi:MFS transporter [Sabulicella glaciei]|uniref:MFS transporter n=1 Tax=Sabulicella glaciei TaxID=2984948 RepID=A0ABT3P0J3_9PROT|nr:MFS transporter [Roseococcus sp. MDT2-1-1]